MGFFSDSLLTAIKAPLPLVPRCGACGLYKKCHSPKMPVDGKGERKILICGEAPGSKEDEQGQPFVGKAGRYLLRALEALNVDLRRDCWITNALICWPWKEDKNGVKRNRNPTDKEIEWCRPNLIRVIEELNPEVIIPLGGPAVQSLLGWLWKDDVGAITRWVGWDIPCQKLNAWIVPNNHPSYCMRQESELVDKFFQKHLKKAFDKVGRPWQQLPNYEASVQVILTPSQAARVVDEVVKMGRPVVFDYEDEALKPDSDAVHIVSCSLSNGVITIAYPWLGEAIQATQRLLSSSTPKIAQNLSHEHRYTLAKLGIEVNNWIFDTMVAAHVLDNRPGVCSLKYQAFVLLGQPSYDDHIKPFFQSPTNNTPNRIHEIDIRQLLHYNAMDSLLTWEIAQIQAKKLGVSLQGKEVKYARPQSKNR